MSEQLPKGWRYELVSPPAPSKLPASEAYRTNWERIFGGKKDKVESKCDESGIDKT